MARDVAPVDASLSSDSATLPVADVPASSSDAEHGDSRSLLDVLNDARHSEDVDSPTKAARIDDDSDVPEEATPEELAKLKKIDRTAQKRIKKLNSQRLKLAGEVERLKTLEPDAQAAQQVINYLRQADISQDDFMMGLQLMAAMRRGDFRMFYEGVQPYMKLCEEYLGISLPADLAREVQQGQMTTQAAMQFSKERMDRAMAQTNAQRNQQALQYQQQSSAAFFEQQRKQQLAASVASTVDAWEAQIARTDPSYAAKRAAVNDTMWAVVKEQGPPQSVEHGLAIAKESLRRVNVNYGRLRTPTHRIPSSTGRTAGVAAEPRSLLEVVQFAREGAAR